MQVNRVVRQRLLKWVAKAATADTEEETEMLMKRHTVNWYNENKDTKKAHEIQNAYPELKRDHKITMTMRSLVERPKADSHNQTNDRGESEVAWRVSEMQIEQQIVASASRTQRQLESRQLDMENGAVAESETHIELLRMGTETNRLVDQLAIHVEPDDHDTATSKHSLATVVPVNNPESMS